MNVKLDFDMATGEYACMIIFYSMIVFARRFFLLFFALIQLELFKIVHNYHYFSFDLSFEPLTLLSNFLHLFFLVYLFAFR